MPAFDPNVFDVAAFEALYATPVLFKVYVPREQQRVAPGQGISISIHIVNVESTPHRRWALNPELVQVSLFDPAQVQLVSFADMVNQGTGVYGFQYQVALAAPTGPYCGVFKATNGTKAMQTKRMKLFEVV